MCRVPNPGQRQEVSSAQINISASPGQALVLQMSHFPTCQHWNSINRASWEGSWDVHCHPRDTCEARTDACAVKSTAPGRRGLPPKAGVAWWMIEQSRAPSGAGISLLSQHLCTAPTPAARLQWRLHIPAADYGSGHAQNIQCSAC